MVELTIFDLHHSTVFDTLCRIEQHIDGDGTTMATVDADLQS